MVYLLKILKKCDFPWLCEIITWYLHMLAPKMFNHGGGGFRSMATKHTRTGVLAADPGGTYEHLAGDRLGSSTHRPGTHRPPRPPSKHGTLRHGNVKTIENPDVTISCNFYVDTI